MLILNSKKFAKALRAKRLPEEGERLTRRAVVAHLGITTTHLMRLEAGSAGKPSAEVLANACRWLEVPMDTFFELETKRTSSRL